MDMMDQFLTLSYVNINAYNSVSELGFNTVFPVMSRRVSLMYGKSSILCSSQTFKTLVANLGT